MLFDEFPVTKYTVQLYYFPFIENVRPIDRDDLPVQIASGVLIKGRSKYYLLTCKHVFDNIQPRDVHILTSAGFSVRFPEEIIYINNPGDSIDLALVEMKKERLAELKYRYSSLSYRNLAFSHIFDEDLYYMLYGYINKRTELKDHAFAVEPFGYLTNIRHYKKFEDMGFNYNENISLEYNRRKQSDFDSDNRQMGPKELKGMSGGGIWLSVAARNRDTYRYFLVGIMIEERLDHGFIIGTKVALLQNLL